MPGPLKILTTVGCGRSGSTILANALGQLPGYVHVGEFCYVWNRGMIQNSRCGCGEPFRACPFWSGVLRRRSASTTMEEAKRYAPLPRKVNRRMAANVLLGREPLGLAAGVDDYVRALRGMYRAVAEESGCRTIVDSTKAPAHTYLLDTAGDLDVRAVHLVRDSRAVCYSWNRKVMRADSDPERPAPMVRFSPARSSLKWAYANLTAEMLRRSLGNRMLTIRYEDFVEAPRDAVAEIVRLADDDVDEHTLDAAFVSQRELSLAPTHTVWGNPSRLRTGLVRLSLDSEWERHMSASHRAVVTAATWPWLRKYGYAARGFARSHVEEPQPGARAGRTA